MDSECTTTIFKQKKHRLEIIKLVDFLIHSLICIPHLIEREHFMADKAKTKRTKQQQKKKKKKETK